MKLKTTCLMILTAAIGHIGAAPLQPVALAIRGESSISSGGTSAPVVLKQTVAEGSVIQTGLYGRVGLALAPGQLAVIDPNTKVSLISAHDDSKGAVLGLSIGSVRCSVDPQRNPPGPSFTVTSNDEHISAKGTVWQTSQDEMGTLITVSLSSTVTSIVKQVTGLVIDVRSGSILISTYENGVWVKSKLINLVTAQVVTYIPDGEGGFTSSVSVASLTELGQARDAFQSALGQGTDLILNQQSAAILVLINQINAALSAAGLPPLTPVPGVSDSNGRDAIVSPEQP